MKKIKFIFLKKVPLRAIFLALALVLILYSFSSYLGFSIVGASTPLIGTYDPNAAYFNYKGIDGTQLHMTSNISDASGKINYFIRPLQTYFSGTNTYKVNSILTYIDFAETKSCSIPTYLPEGGSTCSPTKNYLSQWYDQGYPETLSTEQTQYGIHKEITFNEYGKHYLIVSKTIKDGVSFSPYYTCSCLQSNTWQEGTIRGGYVKGEDVLKIPVIFENPLCNDFYSQGKVLASTTFIPGQTINKASLKEAFRGKDLLTFCYSYPAQYLSFDSNAVLQYSTVPYEFIDELNGYFTVPPNTMIKIYGIIDRDAGVSYSCDVNQYVDAAVVCHPVPAWVDFCGGQISGDGAYCLNETRSRCVDEYGNLVVNATYNVDKKVCEQFIPIDVVTPAIPAGCNITEYWENGAPKKCTFAPSAGCDSGTIINVDGINYCKITMPNVVDQAIMRLNVWSLCAGIVLLFIGLFVIKQ